MQLTLIGAATGVASLTGQHSGALQGHLSTIARSMIDTGQSDWLINVGLHRGCSSVACHGFECSRLGRTRGHGSTHWSVPGPTETVTLQRSGESILSFRLRVDPQTPWTGKPAIDSTGTGQLLCQLESQLRAESRLAPARVITGGAVADQAQDISELLSKGGVVGIVQAIASREDPSGIKAGVIRQRGHRVDRFAPREVVNPDLRRDGLPG